MFQSTISKKKRGGCLWKGGYNLTFAFYTCAYEMLVGKPISRVHGGMLFFNYLFIYFLCYAFFSWLWNCLVECVPRNLSFYLCSGKNKLERFSSCPQEAYIASHYITSRLNKNTYKSQVNDGFICEVHCYVPSIETNPVPSLSIRSVHFQNSYSFSWLLVFHHHFSPFTAPETICLQGQCTVRDAPDHRRSMGQWEHLYNVFA